MKSNTNEKQKTEKKPKVKRKKSANKERYYVNGKEFHNAIAEFYATGDFETIPDQLAVYIKKISEGLSYAPNFINYSYKEDMVGDAIVKMLSALRNRKYDPDSGSWRAGAALPSSMHSLRATSIDNRVLIVGINN